MALTVTLYQHNKRINSTLKPPADALKADFEGVLIDGADVLRPAISFRMNTAAQSPTVYNYARILLFSDRYYFIDNWTYTDGRWIAHMSVDYLASYKDHIGNSEQYVLRSASKKNGDITDNLYPVTRSVTAQRDSVNLTAVSLWKKGGNLKNGYYIVGVINDDKLAVGSVSYYLMSHAQMRDFLNVLMGDFSWLNISEISQEMAQALFNPFQYVVSCRWYPTNPQEGLENDVENMPFGWWTLGGVRAVRFSGESTIRKREATINIPEHPDITDSGGGYDTFLNTQPFTECIGFFEPWGSFDIPCRAVREPLYVYSSIDYITGKGILTVETAVGDVLVYKECIVGMEIQLSQMATNVLGVAKEALNTVSGVAGAALQANIPGAVCNAVSGIISTYETTIPQLSTKGLNGSSLAFSLTPHIVTTFNRRVTTDNERLGSPLAETCKINTLSGYVLCANPSITLTDAMPEEIESVNRYLAEGFFYE